MDDQGQTAQEIRCSVCADPCQEEQHGTLQGNRQSAAGQSVRYLVHLCKGCFLGALNYLRQERQIMRLFYDEPPAGGETFGLAIEPEANI